MKEPMGRRMATRFGFYLSIIVIAFIVWRIEIYLQAVPTILSGTPMQDKAVDAFLEMNRLLTTLPTTLLGAMGILLFGGFKGRACSRELWTAIAGAMCVGLSIYHGYAAYLAVISMLASGSSSCLGVAMHPGGLHERGAGFVLRFPIRSLDSFAGVASWPPAS
jgi:hypothetical protein